MKHRSRITVWLRMTSVTRGCAARALRKTEERLIVEEWFENIP